jgi:hypothetical protein
MARGPYLLGIDFGTEGVRVGIFDSGGTPVVFHSVEFETQHPRPGWAEQDPDEWWSCLVTATKKAMGESGVAAEEIVGLSVDSTAGAGDGRPRAQVQRLRRRLRRVDALQGPLAQRERTGDYTTTPGASASVRTG